MRKTIQLIIFIVVLLFVLSGLYLLSTKKPVTDNNNTNQETSAFDPENTSYIIENQEINFSDGKANGGTAVIFGSVAQGDLNNDGIADAAVLIQEQPGGSGTFYYLAAALNSQGKTEGTNAILLGDRIAPQNIEIKDARIIANYAIRQPGEAMAVQASLGVSSYFLVNDVRLELTSSPDQRISYFASSEDANTYCNGVEMNSAAYRASITELKSASTPFINPSETELVKSVMLAATSGTCQEALAASDISVSNGTVFIPPIDAWAGVSIAMCACKPEVEVNLLQLPGINKVVWSSEISNFDECVAAGNAILESYPRQCKANGQTFVEGIGNILEVSDLIQLDSPRPNDKVTSPLLVQGQARGNWFFEASFPVNLVDWDGRIIAEGIAQAQGDWMTEEFVPFVVTLDYNLDQNIYSHRGVLILQKDNLSRLPSHDNALEIPVSIY